MLRLSSTLLSDELYAFSPGLMSDEVVQWSVVSINPYQGNVTKVCDIGPPGSPHFC